jgi:hypothetical protein
VGLVACGLPSPVSRPRSAYGSHVDADNSASTASDRPVARVQVRRGGSPIGCIRPGVHVSRESRLRIWRCGPRAHGPGSAWTDGIKEDGIAGSHRKRLADLYTSWKSRAPLGRQRRPGGARTGGDHTTKVDAGARNLSDLRADPRTRRLRSSKSIIAEQPDCASEGEAARLPTREEGRQVGDRDTAPLCTNMWISLCTGDTGRHSLSLIYDRMPVNVLAESSRPTPWPAIKPRPSLDTHRP